MDSRDPTARIVSLLSGLFAGSTRVLIGHPFDTAKVLVQTRQFDKLKYKLSTLYKGVTPNLITVGVTTSFNFWLYENARLSLLNLIEPETPAGEIAVIFASGTIAGSILCFITNPLENVKIIQQVSTIRRGTFEWLKILLRCRTTHRGIVANLFQGGIGRGFYLAGYTATKKFEEYASPNSSSTLPGKFMAASVAGICGWIFTFPFDVVRSNMMADWERKTFQNTFQCFRHLYVTGGISSLYSGIGYTLVRAVPVACIALPSYDIAQGFLLRKFADSDYEYK